MTVLRERVVATHTPTVGNQTLTGVSLQLEMVDGDVLEVHQEQIGGGI
jgi:hypothetical protein